ncbi:hypothetical protein [Conexibacter sp. SYSU D00693]|uniref:hypothetical protein n=1 Tax=Conexibacter sp. SYSU D00693 TaxID=2812560 RepID=UPI00196B60F8|nr:hypothetical protein [Conexibacter sp. SYSU D00693]
MIRRLPALAALMSATLATAAPPAGAQSSFSRCPDVDGLQLVEAARASCDDVRAVAAAVGAAPVSRATATLTAAGWTPLRARTVPRSRPTVHDLLALRGRAVLRVRRTGHAPDVDSWEAGRELIFARGTIVGGRPIPRDAAACTSAFLIRLGGRLAGLSAAHCGGLRRDGTVQRRNAAMRRPPAAGIVLGRVLRILTRRAPVDALVLPVPRGTGRGAAPVVDRGLSRPPWVVTGSARALPGRAVCFTGRTSGIDQCGRLRGPGASGAETLLSVQAGLVVRCTTIRARQGDSGGPVYTRPAADGTVRAVGIVTLVVGERSRMCFTPVGPALRRLDATVATG